MGDDTGNMWLEPGSDGSAWTPQSLGLPSAPSAPLPGDYTDMAKMQHYTAGPNDQPWWQNLVMYGATRAIDNRFGTPATGVQGNTAPGSFQGANNAGGGATRPQAGAGAAAQGISPLMLLLIGAAALFALN